MPQNTASTHKITRERVQRLSAISIAESPDVLTALSVQNLADGENPEFLLGFASALDLAERLVVDTNDRQTVRACLDALLKRASSLLMPQPTAGFSSGMNAG